jgi:hypothetical protein
VAPLPRPMSCKKCSIEFINTRRLDEVFGPEGVDIEGARFVHMKPPVESVRRAREEAGPGWVVLPRWVAGRPTALAPLRKAHALLRLTDQSFNTTTWAPKGECVADLSAGYLHVKNTATSTDVLTRWSRSPRAEPAAAAIGRRAGLPARACLRNPAALDRLSPEAFGRSMDAAQRARGTSAGSSREFGLDTCQRAFGLAARSSDHRGYARARIRAHRAVGNRPFEPRVPRHRSDVDSVEGRGVHRGWIAARLRPEGRRYRSAGSGGRPRAHREDPSGERLGIP